MPQLNECRQLTALCILRAQYSGNATDSKPVNVGSIPTVRVLLYLLYVSEPLTQLAYNNAAQYNSITALQREDEGATPFVVLVVYSFD